jgi:hypothetical protein
MNRLPPNRSARTRPPGHGRFFRISGPSTSDFEAATVAHHVQLWGAVVPIACTEVERSVVDLPARDGVDAKVVDAPALAEIAVLGSHLVACKVVEDALGAGVMVGLHCAVVDVSTARGILRPWRVPDRRARDEASPEQHRPAHRRRGSLPCTLARSAPRVARVTTTVDRGAPTVSTAERTIVPATPDRSSKRDRKRVGRRRARGAIHVRYEACFVE